MLMLKVPTVILCALLASSAAAQTKPPHSGFTLSSNDPRLSKHFPEDYTLNAFGCSGANKSPPLRWHGAPTGTRSFVLTLFDRDEHSTPSGWWHWILYDLPATATELPMGAGTLHSTLLPVLTLQGRSDLGTDSYHGPCPDKADAAHRYVFTLYALDVDKLAVPADSSGAMIVSTLQEHLLEKTELVVRHGRQ